MSAVLLLLLSLALVASAVAVVTVDNLVHGVFWLASTLLCTAGVFVFLEAPFIAGVQVLLYTGGVITLMLFGVMLTQREANTDVPSPSFRHARGLVVSLVMLVMLVGSIWTTPELATRASVEPVASAALGVVFLNEQLLAFEALSVLLLASMIGAIVLARKKDP